MPPKVTVLFASKRKCQVMRGRTKNGDPRCCGQPVVAMLDYGVGKPLYICDECYNLGRRGDDTTPTLRELVMAAHAAKENDV